MEFHQSYYIPFQQQQNFLTGSDSSESRAFFPSSYFDFTSSGFWAIFYFTTTETSCFEFWQFSPLHAQLCINTHSVATQFKSVSGICGEYKYLKCQVIEVAYYCRKSNLSNDVNKVLGPIVDCKVLYNPELRIFFFFFQITWRKKTVLQPR